MKTTMAAAVLAAALAAAGGSARAAEHPSEHPKEHPAAPAPSKAKPAPKPGKAAKGAGPAAGHHHEHAVAGDQKTLEGEIVDMACYMIHEGKGKSHRQCAKKCVLGGAPAGLLLDGGGLFLLVENHDDKDAYEGARQLAGERAKVSGKAVERGGLKALIVEKAEAL